MGWFTVKSNSWELKKGWIVVLSVICPLFTIFSLIYMVVVTKFVKILRGIISIVVLASLLLLYTYLLSVFNLKDYHHFWVFDLIGIILMCSLLCYPSILMAANTREFMQRLHLQELFELKKVDYDYYHIIQELRVKNMNSMVDFVKELEYWDNLIVEELVSSQIVELITLMKKIDELKGGKTQLFLEQHSYSLIHLLKQFHQIELSKLSSVKISDMKRKLEDTLFIAIKAIRQEVINEIKLQNISVEVDADLYVENLKREGLI